MRQTRRVQPLALLSDAGVANSTRQRLVAPRAANFLAARWDQSAADTHQYYDQHASAYAEATQSLSMDRWLLPFARLLPPEARVVDLGAGGGRDLRRFAELGFQAVGLDRSLALATLARQHAGRPTIVGDLRQLPLADRSFDGVWASASLLHLARPEIEVGLREAHRILATDGVLFASMKRGQRDGVDRQGRSFTYVTPQEFAEMVDAADFEVLDWDEGPPLAKKLRSGKRPWIACLARRR